MRRVYFSIEKLDKIKPISDPKMGFQIFWFGGLRQILLSVSNDAQAKQALCSRKVEPFL